MSALCVPSRSKVKGQPKSGSTEEVGGAPAHFCRRRSTKRIEGGETLFIEKRSQDCMRRGCGSWSRARRRGGDPTWRRQRNDPAMLHRNRADVSLYLCSVLRDTRQSCVEGGPVRLPSPAFRAHPLRTEI